MKFTSLVLLAVAALFSASMVSAAVINIDANGYGLNQTYAGQGALVTSDAHIWNGLDGQGVYTAQPTPLVDSAGNITAVTFYSIQGSGSGEAGLLTGPNSRGNLLLDDCVYTGSPAPQSFTLGGLTPGGTYDLYLYGAFGPNDPYKTTFTVTSEAGSPTAGTTGGAMAGVTSNSIDASTEGAYYVKFSNLTATAGGEITATYVTDGTTYGIFNGLQIALVPEPATMSLLGLGTLALLRRRR